jgi:hypothetical protein
VPSLECKERGGEREKEAEVALQEAAAATAGEQREAAALVVERVAMTAELQRLSRQAIAARSSHGSPLHACLRKIERLMIIHTSN